MMFVALEIAVLTSLVIIFLSYLSIPHIYDKSEIRAELKNQLLEKFDTNFIISKAVDDKIKKRRLQEVVDLQQKHSLVRTKEFIGKTTEVLIEKESKKSNKEWSGRNPQNTTVVFPKENYNIGDFVSVKIRKCTSATLKGKAIGYSKNN